MLPKWIFILSPCNSIDTHFSSLLFYDILNARTDHSEQQIYCTLYGLTRGDNAHFRLREQIAWPVVVSVQDESETGIKEDYDWPSRDKWGEHGGPVT